MNAVRLLCSGLRTHCCDEVPKTNCFDPKNKYHYCFFVSVILQRRALVMHKEGLSSTCLGVLDLGKTPHLSPALIIILIL